MRAQPRIEAKQIAATIRYAFKMRKYYLKRFHWVAHVSYYSKQLFKFDVKSLAKRWLKETHISSDAKDIIQLKWVTFLTFIHIFLSAKKTTKWNTQRVYWFKIRFLICKTQKRCTLL